jgi:hypothetical protein
VNDLIDYARPLILIEKLVRDIHDQCLNRNYEAAIGLSDQLNNQALELKAVLLLMKAKDEI